MYEKVLKRFLGKNERMYGIAQSDTSEEYCGISRRYFPKWGGWLLIENGAPQEHIDKAVYDFYWEFFWDRLHLERVKDMEIASLLFETAVQEGKKLVIKKVRRVLGFDGNDDEELMILTNYMNTRVFVYHFLLEMLDFYTALGIQHPEKKVLARYYSFSQY